MKRYVQVTKAVKRLICISQQILFQDTHYGVASAKLFMLFWDRFSRRNILVDGLLCELALTLASELDTENRKWGLVIITTYLKNKRSCLLTSTKRSEYNIHITSGKKTLEILKQQPVQISLVVALGL